MGPLPPGLLSPTMTPKKWNLIIIDLKDYFFNTHLHPDNASQFAFSSSFYQFESTLKKISLGCAATRNEKFFYTISVVCG